MTRASFTPGSSYPFRYPGNREASVPRVGSMVVYRLYCLYQLYQNTSKDYKIIKKRLEGLYPNDTNTW